MCIEQGKDRWKIRLQERGGISQVSESKPNSPLPWNLFWPWKHHRGWLSFGIAFEGEARRWRFPRVTERHGSAFSWRAQLWKIIMLWKIRSAKPKEKGCGGKQERIGQPQWTASKVSTLEPATWPHSPTSPCFRAHPSERRLGPNTSVNFYIYWQLLTVYSQQCWKRVVATAITSLKSEGRRRRQS